MSAIQQLEDALQERNNKTSAFLETIISIINESVESLPFCTRANSTPEVAGSVKVLKKDLDGIIAKIRDNSTINDGAVAGLMNRLKLTNLKKAPKDPARLSDSSLRPSLSELNGIRFSDDSQSSPRTSFASANGSPRISETGGKRSRSRRR